MLSDNFVLTSPEDNSNYALKSCFVQPFDGWDPHFGFFVKAVKTRIKILLVDMDGVYSSFMEEQFSNTMGWQYVSRELRNDPEMKRGYHIVMLFFVEKGGSVSIDNIGKHP